jgi:pimeloyl-ACP methyl ester carboxylesterase
MSAARSQELHPFVSSEARDRYLTRYDEAARSWPIPSEGRSVPTEFGQTFVRISGPLDGPPLVLLPGVWASSLMWASVIGALSQRYRTYAVDNIVDFGRSVSVRPVVSTADHMSWLDGLFDALGLTEGINLMGCSRGGWLTGEYTLHAPQRLAKAVWQSPAGVALISYWVGISSMPIFMGVLMSPSQATVRKLMLRLMPDYAKADPRGFDQYVDDTALGLQCFDTKVIGRSLGPRQFSDAELRGIRLPVLYIAGEHEMMYSPAAAVSRLNSVAPRIKTAVIAGAGHDLGVVQTEVFNQTLLGFLDAEDD